MRKIATKLSVFMMLLVQFAYGQDRHIRGTVTSADGPAAYISVQAKGTNLGISTDQQGQYDLIVPPTVTTLVFKGLGFKTKEVDISSGTVFDVTLETDNLQLDQVEVTALGITREKRSLGYATQQVSGDEIVGSGEQNLVEGLAGKVAGVEVISSAGTPGASSKIQIRGPSDFNGGSPLIVIDGIPVNNATSSTVAGDYPFNEGLTGVNYSNRAIDINPDDIESVNVLKGPSAAALYGIAAANGAIIITTKKGKNMSGQGASVIYSSSAEMDMVNKLPDFQNTYAQGTGGGRIASGGGITPGTFVTTGPGPDGIWGTADDINGTNQSWGPKIADVPGAKAYDNAGKFFRTGSIFNNDISISGGNEFTTFRLGLGDMNQTGVIPNTNFHRTSVSLAGDTKLGDKLSVSAFINYINSGGIRAQNGSNTSGLMLSLFRTPPSFNLIGTGPSPGTVTGGGQNQYLFSYDNPYWSAYNNPFTDNVDRLIGNVAITYKPIYWFDITYRLGDDNYTDNRKQVYAIGANTISPPTGEIDKDVQSFNKLYSDLLFTFKHDFSPDINASLILGNELNDNHSEDIFSRGQQLIAPNFYNMSNASNYYASGSTVDTRQAGFFGDLEGSFKNMIYLGVTGREEYASQFSEANNSFFYPSVSGSFVFSELIPKNKVFSFGKIRASIAQVGIAPPAYSDRTYLGTPLFSDGFTNGLTFPYLGMNAFANTGNTIGNPNIIPERVNSSEIGLDLRFFDGRLNFDFTYYDQKTDNIIINASVAPSSGFLYNEENAGTMDNKGIELIASGTPIKHKNFNWDIGLNFSKNTNIVISTGPSGLPLNYETGFSQIYSYAAKGQPFGELYGNDWAKAPDGKLLIGSNGLPIVKDSLVPVGNPNPNWLAGIRNTFRYKNLSLTFLFDIRSGGAIWDGTQARLNRLGVTKASADRSHTYTIAGEQAITDTVTGKITGYKQNTTAISPYDYYTQYVGDAANVVSNAIYDGSWVRLRELTISYHFNTILNKFIKGIDLYVTGRNLWLQTKYPGVDPETSLTGAGSNLIGYDYFNNPGTKSFIFGIKAQF